MLVTALLRFPHRVFVRFAGALEQACQLHCLLRVELNAFGSLNVQVAEERFVPAGEREPGHRRRDADVHADHACVEATFELPGCVTAAGEDTRAIAELALLAESERLVE